MNPLQLLEDPLRALLDFLHDNVNLTYGWSIVVLTLIVRSLLLPLVVKQYKSMRTMQLYAPQLKELQAKYKGNRQKLNEELMGFYKENQVNPFASCLPLVAQLPVFFALYYVLRDFSNDATVAGGDLSFMWLIPNVAEEFTFGWATLILALIYATTQLLSSELSMTPNMPDSQRRLMRILPLIVVVFVFQFPVPTGLVLYWMTTNLWTCGQQLVMRHRIGLHLADPAEVERIQGTAATKKGSRTPAKTAGAAAIVDEETPPAEATPSMVTRLTPRRRRRTADAAPEPMAAPEAPVAPEAGDAPAATSAPEPADAPDAPDAAPADAEERPAPAPSNGSGGARTNGGPRRQPRARGAAKGSRPAGGGKSKKKR